MLQFQPTLDWLQIFIWKDRKLHVTDPTALFPLSPQSCQGGSKFERSDLGNVSQERLQAFNFCLIWEVRLREGPFRRDIWVTGWGQNTERPALRNSELGNDNIKEEVAQLILWTKEASDLCGSLSPNTNQPCIGYFHSPDFGFPIWRTRMGVDTKKAKIR